MEIGTLLLCFILNTYCYSHGSAFSTLKSQFADSLWATTRTSQRLSPQDIKNTILFAISSESSGAVVNGATDSDMSFSEETALIDPKDLLPVAPALSFRKFLTMQERRVVVTIRYAEHAGWKPYYLTAAKKIKASHPDVLLEKRVLPIVEGEEIFEIAVDGKMVISNQAKESTTRKVFCNMVELDLAISRARRRHRPSTAYGIVRSQEDDTNEAD